MDNKELVKLAVSLMASTGAGVVVTNAVKITTPLDASITNKALIGAGTIAISGIVANYAGKYAGDQVDYIFEAVSKVKNRTA